MRYVPLEDEEATLLERAARLGKITKLLELLELVEENKVSIDDLIERLKAGKPWEVQPRVEEIESKVSELKAIAVEQGESNRDNCKNYDGSKCTFWEFKEQPSAIFKTVKDKALWRVVVKEQPEYCAFCSYFEEQGRPSVDEIDDRLSVASNMARWKRDHCEHYDGTKCDFFRFSEEPSSIFKPIKDGKVWRVNLKERPEYCIPCPRFKEREEQ